MTINVTTKPNLEELWNRLSPDGSDFEGYVLEAYDSDSDTRCPISPDQVIDIDTGKAVYDTYVFSEILPDDDSISTVPIEYSYSRAEMQAFYDANRW